MRTGPGKAIRFFSLELLDGGKRPGDVVATLTAFTRLRKRDANLVDCATAVVKEGIDFDSGKLRGIGALTGAGELLRNTTASPRWAGPQELRVEK